MRGRWAAIRSLLLPYGAGPGQPRMVINVTPVPAELVNYYKTAPAAKTTPETVVAVSIDYDGQSPENYSYQAMVIDSTSPKKVTSVVQGASVGGTVNESWRFALDPAGVLGGARFQTFLQENILLLTSATGSTTVFGTQALTDAFHRLSISRDAVIGFGPGNVITDAFIDRLAAGILRIANRLDVVSFGALTDTVLGAYLNGDNNPRRTIRANGEMRGGDGTNTTNATHYWAAAGVWASDKTVANISGTAETWHNLTLLNSWTNAGGTDATLQYRLHNDGTVQVNGTGNSPSGAGFNQTMATLPAGYRPAHSYGQVFIANDGTHLCTVDSSGNIVMIMTNTSTKFWLNFRFPVDAA